MTKNYTTNTASLKATIADIRQLNGKEISLNGKNILDYISDSTTTVKHANDTRETVTENDLWGQYVETLEDGTAIVHDDWVTNPNSSDKIAWNKDITKVEDNKAYMGDTFYCNIQTENIKDGNHMFSECTNLTTFTSDLSSLTDGDNMFLNCNLTTFTSDLSSLTNGLCMFRACFELDTFTSDLSSLTYGSHMFSTCNKLTTFTSDLSSLTDGYYMFDYCTNLTTFTSNLSSLINGTYMFFNCTNLTTFISDLSSLTDGAHMFSTCNKLTTFTSDLSSLTNGYQMFAFCNFTTFTSDSNGSSVNLSSLTNGDGMFYYCNKLTTFTSDLSSLINGASMFFNCNELTTFTSDLSSLINGGKMFNKCKLTPQSVMYIVDSIKDIDAEKKLYQDGTIPYVTLANGKFSSTKGFMSDGGYVYTYNDPQLYTRAISASNVGKLTIGIDVINDSATIADQLQAFAEEATFDSWADLKQAFVDKGWTVTFQYGGTETKITYDLRNGEQIIPCQIFAKLVQVEDKDSAEYCTEDASTFYNIEWGHDVTDTSSYTQFDSLEDAMASWNVFPKENIITTEE